MKVESAWKCVLAHLLSPELCSAFLVMIGVAMAVPSWAHRDRGPDDPCRRQIGASLLHITLYQPQFNPDEEYCEEVPRAGKAVVVVDVTPGELRQVPISVEVVATDTSGHQRTALALPAQMYERGVVDSAMIFDEGYDYVARVVVDVGGGQAPHTLSFPIRVVAWYTAMIKPALLVMGLLALTAISVIRYRMNAQQEKSFRRVNVRRVTD